MSISRRDLEVIRAINFVPPPVPKVGGYVYFIECVDAARPIKIGHARDLGARLNNLQIGCPYDIQVVAFYWHQEPAAEEARLHLLHRDARIRGEWFAPTTELIEQVLLIQQARRDVVQEALTPDRFEWRGKVRAW